MPNRAYFGVPLPGAGPLKPIEWMGSSRDDLRTLPADSRRVFGYVLHVFHKKSTRGIAIPKHDLITIRERWQRAKVHHAAHYHPEGT